MILILGISITGLSVARFLTKHNIPFVIVDTRNNPPLLQVFLENFPKQKYYCGELNYDILKNINKMVVSPGINLNDDFVKLAIRKNIKILGDIDIFFEYVKAPVIGITGTNGKSSVTTLLTKMINNNDLKAVMAGNIGIAALDCLSEENVDYYVLELSSFQLDLTKNMPLEVSIVLNITKDHIDRYPDFEDYIKSKLSIYQNSQIKIINLDDKNINSTGVGYSLEINENAKFYRVECHNNFYLTKQNDVLLNTNQLNILGEHNHSNTLAAITLGDAIGLNMDKMLETIKSFNGLAHRLQKVATINNIDYFNDSKATNTDATIVAIKAVKKEYNNIAIIIGGVAKEEDYQQLTKTLKENVKTVILIGESSNFFTKEFKGINTFIAKDMAEVVLLATKKSVNNDAILLSPACASFDMFDNFEHRGEVFIKEVNNLTK